MWLQVREFRKCLQKNAVYRLLVCWVPLVIIRSGGIGGSGQIQEKCSQALNLKKGSQPDSQKTDSKTELD